MEQWTKSEIIAKQTDQNKWGIGRNKNCRRINDRTGGKIRISPWRSGNQTSSLLQVSNVSGKVLNCIFIRQCGSHSNHLNTIHIFWVSATDSIFPVHQLAMSVPIKLSGYSWRIEGLISFALHPMAGGTNHVIGLTSSRVTT